VNCVRFASVSKLPAAFCVLPANFLPAPIPVRVVTTATADTLLPNSAGTFPV